MMAHSKPNDEVLTEMFCGWRRRCQGTVHAIINATCVVLRDATGLVKIGNLERIPAAGVPVSQWLAKGFFFTFVSFRSGYFFLVWQRSRLWRPGLYCCVVGELTSSGSGKTPVVTAAKFTSLDDEPHAQSLWNWEVRDLADHLVDWADE